MLSTVTFNCQITMNVINWGRQFSEMSRSVPKQQCPKIVIFSQLSNIVKLKPNCQNLPPKNANNLNCKICQELRQRSWSSWWLVICSNRLAQLAGRPHKLTWPRIWSSKRVCSDSHNIRDRNAVNKVSWGPKGQFLAPNIRSASHGSSYEAVFPEE